MCIYVHMYIYVHAYINIHKLPVWTIMAMLWWGRFLQTTVLALNMVFRRFKLAISYPTLEERS